MLVGPAGTGKSSITKALSTALGGTLLFDSVTRSGLAGMTDQFNGFAGLVVIDDMGKIDTPYSRLATVTTFAELCYSGFISKHSISVHVEIDDFQGSAVLNIQPTILAHVIAADDWEAVTQDKTVRYYHLFRPTKPNYHVPIVTLDNSIDFEKVSISGENGKAWKALSDIASDQWSDARVLEHLRDMLRAVTALDGRTKVTLTDYALLLKLMAPMTIERHIVEKKGLETNRMFNLDLLAMLVELASWENLTVARVCRDYKVNPTTVLGVLRKLENYFRIGEKGPDSIALTDLTKGILRGAGALD